MCHAFRGKVGLDPGCGEIPGFEKCSVFGWAAKGAIAKSQGPAVIVGIVLKLGWSGGRGLVRDDCAPHAFFKRVNRAVQIAA